ncbi:hypothetical protein FIBSPDRAFT_968021 [Athelia psychrophila]|uniref:Uncharacterized protein n=1 Tax=Athelia psychrophila TaxID=1759441 RepID=A0A167V2U7_9AGAM|nr:hypothetical protein FIBSPDRAFT_968021 [Fibularhizoctonia sp. CBS 109695]
MHCLPIHNHEQFLIASHALGAAQMLTFVGSTGFSRASSSVSFAKSGVQGCRELVPDGLLSVKFSTRLDEPGFLSGVCPRENRVSIFCLENHSALVTREVAYPKHVDVEARWRYATLKYVKDAHAKKEQRTEAERKNVKDMELDALPRSPIAAKNNTEALEFIKRDLTWRVVNRMQPWREIARRERAYHQGALKPISVVAKIRQGKVSTLISGLGRLL